MKIQLEIPLMLLAALPALTQTGNPKDLFLEKDAAAHPAIKFNIQLDRNGQRTIVPTDYAFQSGDKMKFRFELNCDSYIYILLHSVQGDAAAAERHAGTKGIDIIREEDRRASLDDSYQILFPMAASGMDNRVRAHDVKSMPSEDSRYFHMDAVAGTEKLFVVISPRPLDFGQYFDLRTGKIKAGAAAAAGGPAVPDDAALVRLTQRLLEYSRNAQVSRDKGIDVVDGYAAAAHADNAMMVTVDLRHLPR